MDELRDRNAELRRLQREVDALRADLAVRDGYVADLRARLAEAQEREQDALRIGEVARERLAQIATSAYVRASVEEEAVRKRISDAVVNACELKDRERAQALRALRELRRR
jgi:prefoldin subunit 5